MKRVPKPKAGAAADDKAAGAAAAARGVEESAEEDRAAAVVDGISQPGFLLLCACIVSFVSRASGCLACVIRGCPHQPDSCPGI